MSNWATCAIHGRHLVPEWREKSSAFQSEMVGRDDEGAVIWNWCAKTSEAFKFMYFPRSPSRSLHRNA